MVGFGTARPGKQVSIESRRFEQYALIRTIVSYVVSTRISPGRLGRAFSLPSVTLRALVPFLRRQLKPPQNSEDFLGLMALHGQF
jgi:hypothetical protein